MLIGEEEYKTSETLPAFAKTELIPRGYEVTTVLEDPKDKNNFPDLIDALPKADLLIVSVRRRLLPKQQMDALRAYLDSGKPLLGIRTACHAFAPPRATKSQPAPKVEPGTGWPEFDPQVLGGHYTNHYPPGGKVAIAVAPDAQSFPVLKDLDLSSLVGNGSLYKVSPLDASCSVLLTGSIPDKPAEPIAWTRLYGPHQARIFYTSLGHPDDFSEPAFRGLLLNVIAWALK